MVLKKLNMLKIVSFLITLFTLISIFPTITAEASHAGGRSGNSKPAAYYSSSVSSYGYTANFDRGRSYWNSHSKVNITRSFSSSPTTDRYYVGNSSVRGLLGVMTPYGYQGTVPLNSYWQYTTVYIYENQMRNQSNYSGSRVSYNAAHEIGHTIKLTHEPIPVNSVMVQGFYNIPTSQTNVDRGKVDGKW